MPVADVHHSRQKKYSSYDHLLDRSPAFHLGAVLQEPKFDEHIFSSQPTRIYSSLTADEITAGGPAEVSPVSAQPGAAMQAFSSILFKESVHAIIMRLKNKSLQCLYAQPGRKLQIANNNSVFESCDSYGHFARDCQHHKPNAVAAQNKRNAILAEKNRVQASELQDINKLIKEAERLRAMADTASIAVSDAEDCGSEDDGCAVDSVQASELQ